jgi:L-tyrosine isonitrile synthase
LWQIQYHNLKLCYSNPLKLEACMSALVPQHVLLPTLPKTPPPRTAERSSPADSIIATFNSWAFKREQPSSLPLLRAVVERAMEDNHPIPFALYWGKGPRDAHSKPETDCLDYLSTMSRRIAAAYKPGAAFHLLLTDTHARLNQHSEASINAYYADIRALAEPRGFRTRRLSDVVTSGRAHGPSAEDLAGAPAMVRQLTESARKWYRGAGTPADGAQKYFAMNMVEKRAVETAYPNTIFVTFNNSGSRLLFPNGLPIFYMYSVRKGVAVKPWFMD